MKYYMYAALALFLAVPLSVALACTSSAIQTTQKTAESGAVGLPAVVGEPTETKVMTVGNVVCLLYTSDAADE